MFCTRLTVAYTTSLGITSTGFIFTQENFTDHIFVHHRAGPGGVRPVDAYRADKKGRNECFESLPGASQGDFPGQVKDGMDALDLKGVHYVQN